MFFFFSNIFANLNYLLFFVKLWCSTHRFQTITMESSICLLDLRKGTTYYICIANKGNALFWKCANWVTSLTLPLLNNANAAQFFHLSPRVEAVGTKTIQLTWPPPAIRKPSPLTPPIGYLLLVYNEGTCVDAFQTIIPWVIVLRLNVKLKWFIHVQCSETAKYSMATDIAKYNITLN